MGDRLQPKMCACGVPGCARVTEHWARWWSMEIEAWHGPRGTRPVDGRPAGRVPAVEMTAGHDDGISRNAWAAVLAAALALLGAGIWAVAWAVIHVA